MVFGVIDFSNNLIWTIQISFALKSLSSVLVRFYLCSKNNQGRLGYKNWLALLIFRFWKQGQERWYSLFRLSACGKNILTQLYNYSK